MPGTFEPVAGFRAGGPHDLAPGEWTDDTSMALALADSIADVGWDLDDQAERNVSWWRSGKYSSNGRVFDIGITTSAALMRFVETGNARQCGTTDEHSSGNGSIMRLAPVPIAYHRCFPDQLAMLGERAVESSLPTHASPQCLSSCRYLSLILAGLIHGLERNEVLSPDWEPLQRIQKAEEFHAEVADVAQGSFKSRKPPEIVGSGYVVKSLEAALWAFHTASDFRDAVLAAANLGDDADTIAAVCGQLAGAYWGECGIPETWRTGLAERETIENILLSLIG